MINTFFKIKFKDELDNLEMSREATNEFHATKFDPFSYAFKPKQKKRIFKKTKL